MSAAVLTNLLSGRAQDRLSALQRALSDEFRTLATQQSLLYGALQACDASTQNAYLFEYLDRVDAVLTAATRLRAFVARHANAVYGSGSADPVGENAT